MAQAIARAEAREQLVASRARIVQASDDARRRIERNLHDGAQQRLVSLALSVRLAERKLREDSDAVPVWDPSAHAPPDADRVRLPRSGPGGSGPPLGVLAETRLAAQDQPMLTPTVTYIGAAHTVRLQPLAASTPSVPAQRTSAAV